MSSFTIEAAADALFSVTIQQQAQREGLSNSVLVNGTKLFSNKKYDEAIKEFKRAIGLAPQSSNSADAYNFMAATYLKMNKPEDAVSAYKASIRLNPNREDTHMKLGNVYMSLNRYNEAEIEFKSAINLNPSSTSDIYTLGQLYLQSGRYNEAESQFNKIVNLSPRNAEGYYGLGLAYSKEGRHEDAVRQFKEAISLDVDFKYAYADLGYAYADSGQMEEARKQVDMLQTKDPAAAAVLNGYISKVSAPKIFLVNPNTGSSGFLSTLNIGTSVASLNSSLATPNSSKDFNIEFYFDKPMDMASVLNHANWQIMRSPFEASGGAYNWGLPVPQTEIAVSPFPKNVIYDPANNKATLTFTITQNADGNGTIDPSHLLFKFNGKDVDGIAMDPKANEFDGMAGVF